MTAEEDQLTTHIARFPANPLGFARYCWPWMESGELEVSPGPRLWQREILDLIGEHLRSDRRCDPLMLAVASGHGIGKSCLISMISHWAMSTCVDTRVVVTANTEAQLRTKTWPEMTKWSRMAINAHWFDPTATTISAKLRGHERNWRVDAIPWSENNTEAFAGLHNKGKRIVVILDEASSIPDRIWEVIEGALTDADTEIIWIAFGNPTRNTGRFRECFGRYKHRWRGCQIDSRYVEGTNHEQINNWIKDYGEDSDFVRVRVRGEFPRAGATQFIAGDVVSEARRRKLEPNEYEGAWKILVCDVARFGDNQTVIGIRQGSKFTVLDKLRGVSTVQTARRLYERTQQHDPRTVVIDGDGVGGGVVDLYRELAEAWLKSNPARRLMEFHGGATANDQHAYFNLRANCWGAMREWLKTADIPDDPELEADLTGPEYFFSSKNQIQLEKKEDMKKRGLASPDLGDALAMSFVAVTSAKTQEERDRERVDATKTIAERTQLQYKLTMERDSRSRAAEERKPAHWD